MFQIIVKTGKQDYYHHHNSNNNHLQMPSLLSCSGLDVVFLDTMSKNIICMLVYLYFTCIFMMIFFSVQAALQEAAPRCRLLTNFPHIAPVLLGPRYCTSQSDVCYKEHCNVFLCILICDSSMRTKHGKNNRD